MDIFQVYPGFSVPSYHYLEHSHTHTAFQCQSTEGRKKKNTLLPRIFVTNYCHTRRYQFYINKWLLKSRFHHLIWTKCRLEPRGVDREIAATMSQERRQILSPRSTQNSHS